MATQSRATAEHRTHEYNGITFTIREKKGMFSYHIAKQRHGRGRWSVQISAPLRFCFLNGDLAADAAIDFIGEKIHSVFA